MVQKLQNRTNHLRTLSLDFESYRNHWLLEFFFFFFFFLLLCIFNQCIANTQNNVRHLLLLLAAKALQSCLTLCSPTNGSPPGSPIPGILQAGTLEWVAISFSSAWKWKVKVKSFSHVRLLATPWTAAYQAPPSVGFPGKSTGVGCHCLLRDC